MKIGLVGESYQEYSLPFNAERSVNCYPILDQGGKEVAAMYGTPGLSLFTTAGTGPIRGSFFSISQNRAFVVSGSQLFEIDVGGNATLLGSLQQNQGIVYITENVTQLCVNDGTNLYILTYATNDWQTIVGNKEYVTNGSFTSNTGWTLGSGWTISGGYAYSYLSSAALQQNSPVALVAGQTYTLSYTIALPSFVTDGTFNSATDWTLGAGWKISSNTAVATGAISTAISQTTPQTLISGQTYDVTFTVTRSAGSVAVSLGGGTAGTSISASSTVTQTITAGSTQILKIQATSFTGTISNVIVTPVLAGSVTSSIGGTSGDTQTAAGSFTEEIVAGATQVIAFTGTGFTAAITDVSINDSAFGLPASCGSVTAIDTYFIVNQNGTQDFFISNPNDGTSWQALNFASKEGSPDNLLRPFNAVGQLWLFGSQTTEIWTDTGAALFPFQKISGAKMEVGIYAPATAVAIDNTVIWVGADKYGKAIVYRAQGFFPQRISTTPIEMLIRQAPTPETLFAYTYQEDGHVFYAVSGGGMASTLVYDATTKMWHERCWMNTQGVFEAHLASCCMFAFGMQLVGDRNSGNLYIMANTNFTDNGQPLIFDRIYTHIANEDKRIRYNRLVIGVENGVGLQSGQGSAPLLMMRLSKDGGRTWTDWFTASMGEVGEYQTKCSFRRLGVAEQMTFQIRISDPVKRAITGSYLS